MKICFRAFTTTWAHSVRPNSSLKQDKTIT
ncbi:hypothetical protein V6Z11_D08G103000 [Gossypium hirsutum]